MSGSIWRVMRARRENSINYINHFDNYITALKSMTFILHFQLAAIKPINYLVEDRL